jgi:hypothetical protein
MAMCSQAQCRTGIRSPPAAKINKSFWCSFFQKAAKETAFFVKKAAPKKLL